MGTIIRAVIGFVIALTVLHGTAFWSGLNNRKLQHIRAEIAAEQPAGRIAATLNLLFSPQMGTEMAPVAHPARARDLQS